MPGVKTAISLDKNLFNKVNEIAQELNVSRSRIFALAVQDYIKKQETQSLLAQLNKAYDDYPTEEENQILETMRKSHKKISEQERW